MCIVLSESSLLCIFSFNIYIYLWFVYIVVYDVYFDYVDLIKVEIVNVEDNNVNYVYRCGINFDKKKDFFNF